MPRLYLQRAVVEVDWACLLLTKKVREWAGEGEFGRGEVETRCLPGRGEGGWRCHRQAWEGVWAWRRRVVVVAAAQEERSCHHYQMWCPRRACWIGFLPVQASWACVEEG